MMYPLTSGQRLAIWVDTETKSRCQTASWDNNTQARRLYWLKTTRGAALVQSRCVVSVRRFHLTLFYSTKKKRKKKIIDKVKYPRILVSCCFLICREWNSLCFLVRCWEAAVIRVVTSLKSELQRLVDSLISQLTDN